MKGKLALLILAASTFLCAPSSAHAKCTFYETDCESGGSCDPCADEYYVYNCGKGMFLWLDVGCCICT